MAECFSNTLERPPSPSFPNKNVAIPAKAASFDAHLAETFRSLEGLICDGLNAGVVFETLMNNHFGSSYAKDGLHTFTISHEDWEALFFAMIQFGNKARDLKAAYLAGYETMPPAGSA